MNFDFYKKILDGSLVGYACHKIIYDENRQPCDFRCVYSNKEYQKILEVKDYENAGKKFLKLFPDIDIYNINFCSNIALNNEKEVYEVYSDYLKRWFKIIIYSPQKLYFAIVIFDITNDTKINDSLNLETSFYNIKMLLKTILSSIADGVILADNNGKVLFLNKSAENLTGFMLSDAKGVPYQEIFNTVDVFTHKQNINIVKKLFESGKTQLIQNDIILISKDGSERHIIISVSPTKKDNGNITGAVIVFRDYTEKKHNLKEIEYLNCYDRLTGLYNRKFYEQRLHFIDNKDNYPLTLAIGDVNGLKLINETYGQVMGDLILKKIADVLKLVCRENDIAARLGGDEFAIVMPKTDEPQARKILKDIKELISRETEGTVGVSIPFGYEIKRSVDEEIEDIYNKAEDYMYKRKLSESPSVRGNTINTIISALYEKNKREEQHSHRVSELCGKMGLALNLNDYKVQELKTVGLLHDIGKIAIDDNILNKPGKLNNNEWAKIRRHPEIGYRILSTVSDMTDIASYVLFHHERWDGGGYPKHIKGNKIPTISRIISIADTYDAMTSDRSYRSALPDYIALQELKKNAGLQFDPKLVNVFIEKVLKEK